MSSDQRRISRRGFGKQALAAAIAVASPRGVYAALEALSPAPPQRIAAQHAVRPREQYRVEGLDVRLDNGVAVVIPPLYHEIITARLAVRPAAADLFRAQLRLEQALQIVEAPFAPTASGLTVVIGWGLPYFRSFLPSALVDAHMPVDLAYSILSGTCQSAILDAIRFPSDTDEVQTGEHNHVMFLLRSDDDAILAQTEHALFEDQSDPAYVGDLFQLTSVRKGFIGRGFGSPNVGRQLLLAAGIAGAEHIPERAQLSFGFTSTQQAALAPDNLVSFETVPGATNLTPHSYFAGGCAMHLSHLFQDLLLWYRSFSPAERVARMFSPRTTAAADVVTVPNGATELSSSADLRRDAENGLLGHNATLQIANRILDPNGLIDRYGVHRPFGTPLSLRDDFNTLDNPFAWSSRPEFDQWSETAAPGMHFVSFTATSHQFHAMRLAMDGVLPDGTNLRVAPYSLPDAANGINSFMRATHRQNYLIPPRQHRAFPLVELMPGISRQFLPVVALPTGAP